MWHADEDDEDDEQSGQDEDDGQCGFDLGTLWAKRPESATQVKRLYGACPSIPEFRAQYGACTGHVIGAHLFSIMNPDREGSDEAVNAFWTDVMGEFWEDESSEFFAGFLGASILAFESWPASKKRST